MVRNLTTKLMYSATSLIIVALGIGLAMIALGVPTQVASAEVNSKETSDGAAEVGRAVVRRLTPDHYGNVIADVFGPSIRLGGRFEPEFRVDGLYEIGSGRVGVSSDGMMQYDIMARNIAEQVTSEKYHGEMIPCTPQSVSRSDGDCARQFLTGVGRVLFRRPLTDTEQIRYVAAANVGAQQLQDFYAGLSLSLGAMLTSPQFLFRQVAIEPAPNQPGEYRLVAYSKASRLSFFLWNSLPDEVLLRAAEDGELNTQEGLERQVSRMKASPRFKDGVRAFFTDMFHFDAVPTLAKDLVLYPKFDSIVAADAKEQTLKTLIQLLVDQRGDYRDIFTVRKTFLTQALASVYEVPLVNDVPNGSPDTWQPFEFSSDDSRGGILTHISFLGLHSHPGRSSPTLRGKALREIMFCQKVPAPPGDVDFTLANDTTVYKTARKRLVAHSSEPMCAGCHKITDPMGLALEKFDGIGVYRETENGVQIDTSGQVDGMAFEDAAGLRKAVHDHPAATSCLVDRLFSYALGRTPVKGELSWVSRLKGTFKESGYVVPELMRKIATSPELYRAPPPKNEIMKTMGPAT